MSNSYDVNTKALTVHPSAETVVRLKRFATERGMSRAAAAAILLNSSPDLLRYDLTPEEREDIRTIVRDNVLKRKRALHPEPMRFK